ncbi:MAG: MBOAT family protein [Clostridia bacterium]|nr:MBOAT family protein [Clostridia bacterium]
MNFNSLEYLLFLPTVLILYFLLPKPIKNPMLLAASFFFYMCWEPKYALLMLLSIVLTYLCGIFTEKEFAGRKKLWLVLCLITNLGILFFFKYFNFCTDTLSRVFSLFGTKQALPTLNVLLPVGISFYTFQALGYAIDVYRGDIKAEKNFIDYALFVSFFPQLVAGPIERTSNIIPQLKKSHKFRFTNLRDGFLLIIWGMMKKVLIADTLAIVVNVAYNDPHNYNGIQLAFATLCFSFQIYCDFSAYSDIARGSARIMNVELMRNFDFPYGAQSIKDFWRRWHISLSTWFKDYLYFPLGGSRVSKIRRCLNLMIVFLVSGLWHGAAMTYVVWGFLHGIYQVIGMLALPLKQKLYSKICKDNPVLSALRIAGTFILVNIAWILFRANSLSDAFGIFKKILLIPVNEYKLDLPVFGLSNSTLFIMFISVAVLILIDRANRNKPIAKIINNTVWLKYAVYLIILLSILLFGYYGPGFDPQSFVYFQF